MKSGSCKQVKSKNKKVATKVKYVVASKNDLERVVKKGLQDYSSVMLKLAKK